MTSPSRPRAERHGIGGEIGAHHLGDAVRAARPARHGRLVERRAVAAASKENATSGLAMARRLTTSVMAPVSARSDLRNFSRAGTAANRSAHLDDGAPVHRLRAGPRCAAALAPSSLSPDLRVRRPRGNRQVRNGGDRGQRLAAEPEGADVVETSSHRAWRWRAARPKARDRPRPCRCRRPRCGSAPCRRRRW